MDVAPLPAPPRKQYRATKYTCWRYQITLRQALRGNQEICHCEEAKPPMAMNTTGYRSGCSLLNGFNSLTPGRFHWDFIWIILSLIQWLIAEIYSLWIVLRWISLDLSDDKSTLVQVMAWCRQATSHYLSQCWPEFLSPHGVIRPQWVNMDKFQLYRCHNWTLEKCVPRRVVKPIRWDNE